VSQQARYFLELSFDGTAYHGWQIQPNALTIQEILNKALSTLLRQEIETTGCGRTDTGVHATQFYVHFVLNAPLPAPHSPLLASLNALLPYEIAVKRFIEVPSNAHARFDATSRTYEYHIHFEKDPFKHNLSWLLNHRPDINRMNKAAAILMQYKDFSCFSKSNTQVFTNNCVVSKAEWFEDNSALIFRISADRFLRNMVRAIVGTLIQIGSGELEPEGIRDIIESKDRSNAGASVPACGLYLTEVIYPYKLANK
jgi:tRNA pseudouridine38-40 synthase